MYQTGIGISSPYTSDEPSIDPGKLFVIPTRKDNRKITIEALVTSSISLYLRYI